MRNFVKLKAKRSLAAMLRIAGIIALVAVTGFSMIACGSYFDPRLGSGGNSGDKSSGNNPGDTGDPGDPGAPHTHTYSTTWSFDATQHWHECTANDGAKSDEAAHDGSLCTVCGYDSSEPLVAFSSVTADGSTTATTTELTLTFSAAITGLSASDITLSGVAGVTKGTLSGAGPTYTLPISGFTTGGTLTVTVAKTGYNISGSHTVAIHYATPVTFSSVTADGSATATTTTLTLTFSAVIPGLSASDITLSGVAGVTKGTLSGAGPTYTLPISGFTTGGELTVTITKPGYNISGSQTVTIYYFNLNLEMVFVPGGSFQMGGDGLSSGDGTDSIPVHTVTLTQGFYIGKYEVTQAQWYAVMETTIQELQTAASGGPTNYGRGNNYPVYYVSWYNALVFCNKLSVMEGLTPAYRISGSIDPTAWGTVPTSSNATWNAVEVVNGSTGYRLPTEAQWEYAAKGGNGSPGNYTYAGSNTVGDVAWYSENSGGVSHEVGTKAANGLGLYDMSGNEYEWCWDWSGSYSNGVQTDPTGASSGPGRVIRGGRWNATAQYARSAYRYYDYPSYRSVNLGFRVLRP